MMRRTAPIVAALLFAVVLALWGNVAAMALGSSAWLPGGSWSFAIAGAALVALSLGAARAMGLDGSAIGLAGDPLRGAALGLALGVGAALVGVVALRSIAPAVVGRAIEYAPLATVTGPELARHSAFFLPLGDIFPEEIAFRGVLLGALARSLRRPAAILVCGAAFALWHLFVVGVTIADTTIAWPSSWYGIATAGALGVLFAGGALFAWLRLRTRTIATTIVAHWSFNVVLLFGLWSTQPAVPSGCC